MSCFADDNSVFLSDNYSIDRFIGIIAQRQRVSGTKVNYKKTFDMFLSKWSSRSDHPFKISWGDSIILLVEM